MKSPTTICPSTTSTSTSTAPINDLEPNMDQPSSRPSDGAASTDDQSSAADLNKRHAGDQPLQSPKHSAPAYVKQRHLIWHNRVFYPESISRQGQLAVASDLAAARDRVQQQTVLLAVAQRQLSELEKCHGCPSPVEFKVCAPDPIMPHNTPSYKSARCRYCTGHHPSFAGIGGCTQKKPCSICGGNHKAGKRGEGHARAMRSQAQLKHASADAAMHAYMQPRRPLLKFVD